MKIHSLVHSLATIVNQIAIASNAGKRPLQQRLPEKIDLSSTGHVLSFELSS